MPHPSPSTNLTPRPRYDDPNDRQTPANTAASIQSATLLSSAAHTIPNRLLVTELFFSVPLDHGRPDGRTIKVFCRAAERPSPALGEDHGSAAPLHNAPADPKAAKPWLVFIPGGPGFGSPPPQDLSGLTQFVLEKGYKLLCFDHRGMGMSGAITARSLERKAGVEAQGRLLKKYRATEAVRDLEAIRLCLTDGTERTEEWGRRWSIMGQSYGGFVCTTYLSFCPLGLREVWVLGGLPPVMERKPDEVIRGLVGKVRERNDRYYEKYAEDVGRVRQVVVYLKKRQEGGDAVRLPNGGTLSADRFLELGIQFGFHGGLDAVHNVVLRAWRDLEEEGEMSRPTLGVLERMGPFDESVLYAVLHEAICCQGRAAEWAFDRVIGTEEGFGSEGEKERYLFTGEMVFRRAFDDYAELKGLKDVVDQLMKCDDWPDLYDVKQLSRNEVPVYAAVFVDDMYVGLDNSLKTAKLIRGCKTFITNQLYHNAYRGKSEELLKPLFDLRDDSID